MNRKPRRNRRQELASGEELENLAPETRARLEALCRQGLERLRNDERVAPDGTAIKVEPGAEP